MHKFSGVSDGPYGYPTERSLQLEKIARQAARIVELERQLAAAVPAASPRGFPARALGRDRQRLGLFVP